MKLRLDYITITALLIGFYIPAYAFIGEVVVNTAVIIMAITALIMLLGLNSSVVKFKQTTPTEPKTIQSKVVSWILIILMVGLAAQAGYVTAAFAILILVALNKILAEAIKSKVRGA